MTNAWKKDFPWFKNNPNAVYFDSAATSLAPQYVIEAMNDYYTKFAINHHNEDAIFAHNLKGKIQSTRELLAKFMNCDSDEVIFTSGATDSMNKIAGMLSNKFKNGGEIVMCKTDHNSSSLPWINKIGKGVVVKYAETKKNKPTLATVLAQVNQDTKAVLLTQKTNLLGTVLDIKKFYDAIKKINKDIYVIVDGAQSAPTVKINLQLHTCDFFFFSGHKIHGPTGIGVMYINKKNHSLNPQYHGGGAVTDVYAYDLNLKKSPEKFEAGTMNVSGILGLKAAIEYHTNIGLETIWNHINEIRDYLIVQMKDKLDVEIYNEDIKSPTLVFNIKGVKASDVASFLGGKGIIVRAGWSCSNQMKEVMELHSVIRISFAIYNTKADVDKLINVLKDEKTFLSHIV